MNETDFEILSLKVQGFTNKEISEKTGISKTAIQNKVSEFAKSLGINDPNTAFSFFKLVRKNKDSLENTFDSMSINSMLRRLGISQDFAKEIISTIDDVYQKTNQPPDSLLQSCSIICQMSEENNIPADSILDYISEKQDCLDKIKDNIKRAEIEKREAIQKRESALQKSSVTLEDLKEYNTLKQTLLENGFDIAKEPQKLVPILKQAESLSYDPKKIVAKLQQSDTLDGSIKQQQKTHDKLESENQNLQKSNSKLGNEIKQKRPTLDKLNMLESVGIDYSKLEKLHSTIKEIAKHHDISESEAFEKFYSDVVSNYDVIVGLENTKTALDNSIKKIRNELDKTNQSYEDIQEKYKMYLDAIDFVKELQKNHIDPLSIKKWKNTIKRCDMTPMEFHNKIQDCDDFEKFISKLQKKKSELQQEIAGLETKQNHLSVQVQKLIAERDELINITSILKKIIESVANQYKSKLEYRQEGVLSDFDKKLICILKKYEELIQKMAMSQETIAKADFMEPLYKMYKNKRFDPKTLPVLHDICSTLEICSKNSGYDRLSRYAANIKEEIYKLLTSNAQA